MPKKRTRTKGIIGSTAKKKKKQTNKQKQVEEKHLDKIVPSITSVGAGRPHG